MGGVLEAAEPVTLNSERELQKEIETIARNLDPKASCSLTPLARHIVDALNPKGAWSRYLQPFRAFINGALPVVDVPRAAACRRCDTINRRTA